MRCIALDVQSADESARRIDQRIRNCPNSSQINSTMPSRSSTGFSNRCSHKATSMCEVVRGRRPLRVRGAVVLPKDDLFARCHRMVRSVHCAMSAISASEGSVLTIMSCVSAYCATARFGAIIRRGSIDSSAARTRFALCLQINFCISSMRPVTPRRNNNVALWSRNPQTFLDLREYC